MWNLFQALREEARADGHITRYTFDDSERIIIANRHAYQLPSSELYYSLKANLEALIQEPIDGLPRAYRSDDKITFPLTREVTYGVEVAERGIPLGLGQGYSALALPPNPVIPNATGDYSYYMKSL